MEGIVVTGGEYDAKDRYKYNFVESSINQLLQMIEAGDDNITWLVMTTGYSSEDLELMKSLASHLDVGFQEIGSADEFTNYLNSKSISKTDVSDSRLSDKITEMNIFGHGVEGSAQFGYLNREQKEFAWLVEDANNLQHQAFDKAKINFYTCNASTYSSEFNISLGQAVSNSSGATVSGFQGRTEYKYMNKGQSNYAKVMRYILGFNIGGSKKLPTGSPGINKIIHTPGYADDKMKNARPGAEY